MADIPRDESRFILALRGGLSIYPSTSHAIDDVLQDLHSRLPARFLLLAEVSGQVIATAGELDKSGDTTALAALVAGDLAASHAIAQQTGEYQEFQMCLREGTRHHLFTMQVGTHLALLVQVSHDVPLGWARLTIGEGARRLDTVLATPPPEAEMGLQLPVQRDEPTTNLEDAWSDIWTEDK